jgi:hypothetical protein
MSEKNEEYVESLSAYRDEQIEWFTVDILEEIDDIERTLDTESSKMLLNWVRDKILRVRDEYKERD